MTKKVIFIIINIMEKKTTRKLKKSSIIIAVALAVLLIIGSVFLLMPKKKEAVFFINGSEQKELSITVPFGEPVSLDPADLKLTAMNTREEDLSEYLTYEAQELQDTGTYEITYRLQHTSIKDSQFIIKVTVADTEAPVLEGPSEQDWNLGDTFVCDAAALGVQAQDNHDGDVSDQIICEGAVDAQTEGTYEVTFTSSDAAKNTAQHVLHLHVKEKQTVPASADNLYTDPRSITPEIIDPNSISVLVNKYHAIPDGWAPNDLVAITSNSGRDMYLRSEAAAAWEQLNQAAQAQGITIRVVSSFRTASYQANLFNNYYASDGANAFLYSALSRRSEHELGLAIDVSYDAQLHEDLLDTAVGQFMNEEGYKYGFILRYPSDKIAVTGYGFEAWHYRYVGTQLATELKQRGIVLEEY